MAEAPIPQLVASINDMLCRIARIHEYEVLCLQKENRFLAAQAKAALSIRAHHERPQLEPGVSTPEPDPLGSPKSQTSAPEPWSASSTQQPESQQQHQAQALSAAMVAKLTSTSEAKLSAASEERGPQRLSAQQLRQFHIAARMRVIGDSAEQEEVVEQGANADAAMPVPVQMQQNGVGSIERENTDHCMPPTPESSQDDMILPETLAQEMEQRISWPEQKPPHACSLEHVETACWAPWQALDTKDFKDVSTVDGFNDSDSVELCSVWKARRRSLGRIARRALSLQKGGGPYLPVVESQSTTPDVRQSSKQGWNVKVIKSLHRMWQRMIARPSSHRRLFWDLIGMLLIGYDVIVIPLGTFDPPPNLFTRIMAWICTLYWTFDIPCTLLVGYHTRGVLEMRPMEITKHYIRTWFAFDVGVVSVDWMCTIAENWTESSNNRVGYLRFGRFGRFLRMFRLLRLLKLHGMLVELFERIHSEFVRIMLGIVNVLVFIVLVNHVIACGWYWVGTHSYENSLPSWVVAAELGHRTMAYNYTTSVHWSLTQFTPASMEVVPQNTLERTYNVLTLLFAMCTFSSFVSSITNAMTRLRNLHSDTVQKATVLRQYLKENQIPGEMSNRIWAWLQNIEDTSRCRIHEDEVAILPMLPALLQTELHSAIYMPFLDKHPFFSNFAGAFPDGMRSLYTSFVEVGLAIGKELFHCGEAADRMWFVFSGQLRYLREGDVNTQSWELGQFEEVVVRCPSLISDVSDNKGFVVGAGQWISEHPLWIHWHHVGQLMGLCHTELFAVTAKRFQEVMQYELHGVWQAAKYARCFLNYLHTSQVALSDVWADRTVLNDLATRAFTVTEDDIPSSSSESSNQFSSPRSRPSPPLGRCNSSHRHSRPSSLRPSAASRQSRQSQYSHSRDSHTTQGSVRDAHRRGSLGTPSQQMALPVSRNSVFQHEASDSDPDAELVAKRSFRHSGQGLPVRSSRPCRVESI